jgi:ParB/RepB/Spo0J family partition protein
VKTKTKGKNRIAEDAGETNGPAIHWQCVGCGHSWHAHSHVKKCPKCKADNLRQLVAQELAERKSGPWQCVDCEHVFWVNGVVAHCCRPECGSREVYPVAEAHQCMTCFAWRMPDELSCPDCGNREFSLVDIQHKAPDHAAKAIEAGRAHINGSGKAAPRAHTPFEEWKIEQRVLDVAIENVFPSPHNPRKTFDEKYIDELAASIEANGVLQRLLVHAPVNGRYELVAGECRLRALHKLFKKDKAKWGLVPIEVKPATLKQAAVLRLEENLRRQDLNPIDLARAYHDATTTGGFTQQELADSLHLTQGAIANKVRLLKLPEGLQKRIITAEISERRAREWLKFADLPGVLEHAAKEWKKELPEYDEDDSRELSNMADEVSRPMHQNTWQKHRQFKTSPAVEKELDIRELPAHYGGRAEKRAFNVKRWDELQAAAEARAGSREAKREKSAAASASKETPAERKAKAKKLADQFDKRLYGWKVRWLQTLCARELLKPTVAESTLLKLVLLFTVADSRVRRKEDLAKAARTAGAKMAIGSATSIETLWSAARGALAVWMEFDAEGWHGHLRTKEIEALAAELSIDLKKEWKLTQEFLELHTKDQLVALCDEWKIVALGCNTRKELISWIQNAVAAKPIPRAVLDVKGK